ncbi:hypothetical protein Bbelb_298990 [Branchiostoma belcheri]|nr:hypothetical protein Bbelb_298990 [Branchiostoma belcheri]
MYRSFCVLVYVLYTLYLYGGDRLAVGQTTENTTDTSSFTGPTNSSSVESTAVGTAAVTSTSTTTTTVQPTLTASVAPQTTTSPAASTTVQPALTAIATASVAPQTTTNYNAFCRNYTYNGTTSPYNYTDQYRKFYPTSYNHKCVYSRHKQQRDIISCCYASSTFMVGQGRLNTTTCVVHVSIPDPTLQLTFAHDTLAHAAIACGGGISFIVLVLCLVASMRNRMEQKAGKSKGEEFVPNAINSDAKIEGLQPQRCGVPRRTTLDSVFEVSHSSSDPQTPAERSRGYVVELDAEDRRVVGPYRAEERYERESYEHSRPSYEHSRPSPDRRHHDVSSSHPMSTFSPHEDERLRQFSRSESQPRENYGRPYETHDFWGMNHYGNEWETPPYHRGIRSGPPSDFDMY